MAKALPARLYPAAMSAQLYNPFISSGCRYWYLRVVGIEYYIGEHQLNYFRKAGKVAKRVDHIDGNKLNNGGENLRECSVSQNNHNSKLSSRNTSGYKGVSFNKRLGKWVVNVALNGKLHSGGVFLKLEDAVEASIKLRNKLHGEFARNK